jgi:hypothetical protein
LWDILIAAVRAALRYEFPALNESPIQALWAKRIEDIRWHMKGRSYCPASLTSTYKQIEDSWASFKFEDEKAAEREAAQREADARKARAYDATPCLFSSTSTAR